jgi:hypothetical protein
MITQVQPSAWSCFPTALAMCLDVPVQRMFDLLGHDGSEILWPELPEPLRRRSFAFQEMIHLAYLHGYALCSFQPTFYVRPTMEVGPYTLDAPPEYLADKLRKHQGVLTGVASGGSRHAVAWDGQSILDPNGTIYPLHDFTVEYFWAMIALKEVYADHSASPERGA